MAEAPAFYARRGGRRADWWTLLHPPYTVWHLSYVVLGAAMAPRIDGVALVLSVLAFFLAVGIAAHAYDERAGHPLGTAFTDRALMRLATAALAGAVLLGLFGVFWWDGTNWALLVAIPVGACLVVGYNAELFHGMMHSDLVFALGWGGFPVVVGYVAQSPGASWRSLLAVAAATGAGIATTYAQRFLSTPARQLRRRTVEVSGTMTTTEGDVLAVDRPLLLVPLERALRALSCGVPLLALAALLAHL
ncbi:hypothetical protein [Nocardioides sp. CER19]|uniref:hypothetical protein n=1 Tax=Nocardioides sp. CER19 TaxID=3038538 RepID=UPI0024477875|nr:hypothetical protein [Nocardioides sp. CER19]MDH2414972.1 hypothetical protein [Nocardioides sp. CER19]